MKRTRHKTKKKASKVLRRPKPRGGKFQKRFITSAEARRRAERHVLKRLFQGATVRDGAAVRLNLYHRGNWTGKDVWVVYKNPDNPLELKASSIIAVCKRTGRVLYEGSAGDEG